MVNAPLLPTFDVPVPLMVEQLLVGVLFPLDFRVAEQVIEVPKILLDDVPERTAVRVTQLAEQLVEVPTPVSCMEQVVGLSSWSFWQSSIYSPRTEYGAADCFADR